MPKKEKKDKDKDKEESLYESKEVFIGQESVIIYHNTDGTKTIEKITN